MYLDPTTICTGIKDIYPCCACYKFSLLGATLLNNEGVNGMSYMYIHVDSPEEVKCSSKMYAEVVLTVWSLWHGYVHAFHKTQSTQRVHM